jgi:hypothetical protein
MNYPVSQRIETDVLYPVSFSQSSTKFVFDKKGILDANSQLQIKLLVPDQAGPVASNAFLPINTGISAVVSRAWLEIGGRRVSTLESVGDFNTFLNTSYNSDYKKQILKSKEGFLGNVGPASKIGATDVGRIGTKPLEDANADPSYKLTATSTSPTWSLSLSRLIPMLKDFQLPLFAIDQEVSLVVEWNKGQLNKRYCLRAGEAEVASTIDQDSCVIMADYLFYPMEMDDIAMKIGSGVGYSHIYDEVITIESTENATGADPGVGLSLSSTFSHNIALAGKTLKAVVCQAFKAPNALCGVYVSNDDQKEDTYNFTINSRPMYANDIKNTSSKYKEVSSILERPLNVNCWEYGFINQVDDNGIFAVADSGFTDFTFEGTTQQERTACQNWTGMSLSSDSLGIGGRKMSNLPIILRRNRNIMNANVYPTAVADFNTSVLMRMFAITSKVLVMKDGQTTIVQ